MRRVIIAVDGPAGAGKSSVAKGLAERFGYLYIDSGALYRALAYVVTSEGLDPARLDEASFRVERTDLSLIRAEGSMAAAIDGKPVDRSIRTPAISRAASLLSTHPPVREKVNRVLRAAVRGIDAEGFVIEGRDIGTVVFPEADLKLFLDAPPEVRGERRWRELRERGIDAELAETIEEVRQRDRQDRERPVAPLIAAPDAQRVDTSSSSLSGLVETLGEAVGKKLNPPGHFRDN